MSWIPFTISIFSCGEFRTPTVVVVFELCLEDLVDL